MSEPRSIDESIFGEARYKGGKDGKTVRLALLVRWLMERHEVTRVDAVQNHLFPPLEGNKAPVLYGMQQGSYALPIEGIEWFETGDGKAGPAPGWHVLSRGIGSAPVPRLMAPSLGHGTAGAVAWLRLAWGDSRFPDAGMDVVHALGCCLAVSETDAAAVWGYGAGAMDTAVVGAMPAVGLSVVPFKKSNPEPDEKPKPQCDASGKRLPWKRQFTEWTGERLAAARLELGNVRDSSKMLEQKTGLPVRQITAREKEWRDDEERLSAEYKRENRKR